MATRALEEPEAEDELDEEERMNRILEQSRSIIHRLDSMAQERIRQRGPIEQRWISDLRLYYGRYDDLTAEALKQNESSQAFVKLVRHKTDGWAARLADLLFPTDERNWGIKPTPLPSLARAAKDAVAAAKESVEGANQAAQAQNPQAEAMMVEQANAFAQQAQQTNEEMEEARRRCENMERAIDDQLVECQYQIQCRDVIEDGCRIGTGILKGPLTSQKLRSEWRQNDELGGKFELTTLPDPMPEYRRVDPWHFFPDMSARTIQEAEDTLERHLPTKRELRKLALKLGFNKAAVGRLLKEGAPQFVDDSSHLVQLRSIVGEGEAIENRYVMWEYHGALDCDEVGILLRAAGDEEAAREYEEEKDPLQEYRVILYFCGNELLKISPDYPLDSGESLYSVWNFSKGETSIFGIGCPNIMADSSQAINSAWRMMLDNSALSVGPQIVVDKDQIAPQERGDWRLKPLKVWLRSSTANPAKNPPFEVHNIPNNQQQLAGIIELGKQFIDEETSMPTIAQGEQGAATQTLGGMSILFNSANVVFRRVVKSFDDDLTTPTLRRAYDWNMQFNPDESIKGDMQVDARGTSVLLVREIQSQNLLNVVTNWSVHQVLGGWIKVRPSMAKALQTMMITPDDVLFTQDEYDKEQAKIAEQQAQQQQGPIPEELRLQAAQIDAETRLQVAQLAADTKMAEIASREGLTREQAEAKYGIEQLKMQSAERRHAVDIAVEDRRAKEAAAQGESKTDARGQGVG